MWKYKERIQENMKKQLRQKVLLGWLFKLIETIWAISLICVKCNLIMRPLNHGTYFVGEMNIKP